MLTSSCSNFELCVTQSTDLLGLDLLQATIRDRIFHFKYRPKHLQKHTVYTTVYSSTFFNMP